ncbi:MAG: Asp23/Gls24 family envelope stress response protein [Faecousia sp.]
MAENKQYITQVQENGSVMISQEVIATIAAQAVVDVEGVNTIGNKPGVDMIDMIQKKSWGKGIKIVIDQDDALSVECGIIVNYGQSVVSVAKAVQEAISSAINSMMGITVASVNVNVCGIARQ